MNFFSFRVSKTGPYKVHTVSLTMPLCWNTSQLQDQLQQAVMKQNASEPTTASVSTIFARWSKEAIDFMLNDTLHLIRTNETAIFSHRLSPGTEIGELLELQQQNNSEPTLSNHTSPSLSLPTDEKKVELGEWLLSEVHFLKAIVLIVVVILLLLSSCKIVFQTFSRYTGKSKDDHA